jgi:flagellar motor switch protein FliM
MDRLLSQQEIDNAFRSARDQGGDDDKPTAEAYDFRRTDRIAKEQLRTIHLLHENFTRSMSSSLSAYLRSYVVVNLISVEQLSFLEFTQSLSSPTCLMTLGMKPYDGSAILEMNPSLVFPIVEMLLGGNGKAPTPLSREITEIEQSVLEGVLRVILNDLRSAWVPVASMDFSLESQQTEPQLLQILAHNEAVVAIGIEVRIGEASGMMNLGIPSIVIKMLRQKFDQHRTVRKSLPSESEQERMLNLVRSSEIHLDVRIPERKIPVSDLLDLREGDILMFDHCAAAPLGLFINGKHKYSGEVVAAGGRRALQIGAVTVATRSITVVS